MLWCGGGVVAIEELFGDVGGGGEGGGGGVEDGGLWWLWLHLTAARGVGFREGFCFYDQDSI